MRKSYHDNLADFYDNDNKANVEGDINFYIKNINRPPILDVGCGTGRITIPLLTSGWPVFCIDNSMKMLNRFKKNIKDTLPEYLRPKAVYCEDVFAWNNPNKTEFGSIILSFNVFYYFLSSNRQQKILNSCYRWLKPKGRLFIDVFNKKEIPEINFDYSIKKGKFTYDRFKIIKNKSNRKIDEATYYYITRKNNEIVSGFVWENRLRYASSRDIFTMLTKAGFKNIKCFGDYQKHKFTENSNRMIFIAGK
jgi:SAM-dependent methyltransferase